MFNAVHRNNQIMLFITIFLATLLSVFSTIVMSYISMAVHIGPWIAPTLVLCATFFFRLYGRQRLLAQSKCIAQAVVAGSIGGIVATAVAFSFPTLYFLDASFFQSWMERPFYFVSVVGVLAFIAGWFGLWIANVVQDRLLIQEHLDFPVGQLVYKMISAQEQVRKSIELMGGFVGSLLFCFLQNGFWHAARIIPRFVSLVPAVRVLKMSIPAIRLDLLLLPMLVSIGFITGHVIAIPLVVGILTQVVIAGPIHASWFADLSVMEFILAFGSGMVLSGVLPGLFKTCQTLISTLTTGATKNERYSFLHFATNKRVMIEGCLLLVALIAFLSYFGFSLLAQLYLIFFTVVCAYQIALIAGQIGLAQLGRFATFVMVPGMLLFKLNFVQITLLSTLVEITGGVVADALFGRKVGYLAQIDTGEIRRYQYFGLAICSMTIGVVFWLLINHFQLGSVDLLAIKAQSRQMLIHINHFNYYILLIGTCFGFLLQYISISPMLVLGGLLMPVDFSLGLIVGGLWSLFLVGNRERYYPIWSGIFAGNSVWMLLRAASHFFS